MSSRGALLWNAFATEQLWNVFATEQLWNAFATEQLWNVFATEQSSRDSVTRWRPFIHNGLFLVHKASLDRHLGSVAGGRLLGMSEFPADRYLRAARGLADVSQRELAQLAGVQHHVVARMEHTPGLARVTDLARLLGAVDLHLLVVDDDGREVAPEAERSAKLRDRGRRRFPAHLDVRPGADGWWGDGWPMFMGRVPQYTFDRSRGVRDWRRGYDRLLGCDGAVGKAEGAGKAESAGEREGSGKAEGAGEREGGAEEANLS